VKIDSYSFGSITINGQTYNNDVIIRQDMITVWWRKEGHLLQVIDVTPLIEDDPDILVVGTGYSGGMQISREVEQLCADRKIELLANRTTNACQIYNRLTKQRELAVIAALHLTC
jgi:hypothetical protein